MIMVRANELACRDEWAHDLWASRDEPEIGVAASNGGIDRFASRRLPPATADEIAAVARAGSVTGNRGLEPVQEDVVLAEARVMAESDRDWGIAPEPEVAPAAREIDARAAILKAREAYRERVRGAAIQRPGVDADQSVAGSAAESAIATEADRSLPSDSADGGLFDSSFVEARMSDRDDRGSVGVAGSDGLPRLPQPVAPEDRFGSIPEVRSGFDLPRPRPVAVEPVARTAAFDHGPAREVVVSSMESVATLPGATAPQPANEQPSTGRLVAASRPIEEHPVRRRPILTPRSVAARPPVRSAPSDAELDTEDRRRGLVPRRSMYVDEGEPLTPPARRPLRDEPPPVPAHEVADRWSFGEAVVEPVPPFDGEAEPVVEAELVESVEDQASSFEAAPALPATDGIDLPIEATVEIAPHLPRICRGCRDFRPAEEGERGWCTNEWAFTHRRVVDGAERSPCATSLGNWWLPTDDVWSAAVDVASHGQPTPLLDVVVAYHRGFDRPPEVPIRHRRRS